MSNTHDSFNEWVTLRSFALLTPVCRIGLAIMVIMLVLVDPIFYANGLWDKNPQYFYLAVWHVAMALYLITILLVSRLSRSHGARYAVLQFFFIAGTALYAWFGVISWLLSGDFSFWAMAILCMASVFCFPGHLRRGLYLLSVAAMSGIILKIDTGGIFMASGVFVSLAAAVVFAFVVDGYMMKSSMEFYLEQQRVEAERARADSVLYNALPMSIANELKLNNTVKAEKYQHMTVLFADIVGFTKFSSSLPPDAVIHILNQIFSEFDDLVEAHQVEKIKTIGDAYMVVGKGKGNVVAVADLALQMLKSMERYNAVNGVNFALRIGIHIGPTVAGVIGLKRFLYDVWGDAVNTASRMESMGTPGRIQVSEAYRKELGTAFAFEDRGEVEVKGKGLMHTYYLLGRNPSLS